MALDSYEGQTLWYIIRAMLWGKVANSKWEGFYVTFDEKLELAI